MKAVDIILPPAKTNLEEWERWKNRMQSELQSLPYYHKKKIDVLAISITTKGEVSWGKDTVTGRWVAGASFSYD